MQKGCFINADKLHGSFAVSRIYFWGKDDSNPGFVKKAQFKISKTSSFF